MSILIPVPTPILVHDRVHVPTPFRHESLPPSSCFRSLLHRLPSHPPKTVVSFRRRRFHVSSFLHKPCAVVSARPSCSEYVDPPPRVARRPRLRRPRCTPQGAVRSRLRTPTTSVAPVLTNPPPSRAVRPPPRFSRTDAVSSAAAPRKDSSLLASCRRRRGPN